MSMKYFCTLFFAAVVAASLASCVNEPKTASLTKDSLSRTSDSLKSLRILLTIPDSGKLLHAVVRATMATGLPHSMRLDWDFGDGSAPVSQSDTADLVHDFPVVGLYKVSLVVTDTERHAIVARTSLQVNLAWVPFDTLSLQSFSKVRVSLTGLFRYVTRQAYTAYDTQTWTRPILWVGIKSVPAPVIVWDGLRFHVKAADDLSYTDTTYPPSTSDSFEGLTIDGSISPSSSDIDSVSTAYENYWRYLGKSARFNDIQLTTLHAEALHEAMRTKDSLVFTSQGITLRSHLTNLKDSTSNQRNSEINEAILQGVLWSSDPSPKLTVVFYR